MDMSQRTEFGQQLLYFFWKFCFSLKTSSKESFDVTTTQMPIFVLFVSAGVLFEGAFSLWVSLKVIYFLVWYVVNIFLFTVL